MATQGLRRRDGRPVSLRGISDILNNPFYAGMIVIKKNNETYAGIHEPIISQVLFEQVQQNLHGKANRAVIKHRFLFACLFRCQLCGFHLIGETHKAITYYRCHTPGCPTGFIREEKLEQALLRPLKKLEFTQDEKDYFRGKISELRKDWINRQQDTIQSLRLQLAQIDQRLEKLTDAYVDQLLDKESFERRKTTLIAERRSIQNQMDENEKNPLSFIDQLQLFLERAGSAYLTYRLATLEEKRELINILTSNRRVEGKSLEIMLNSPFDLVADRFSVAGGGPSRDTHLIWDRLIHTLFTLLPSQSLRFLLEHEM